VRAKKPAKIKNDERVGKHMYKRWRCVWMAM